MSRQKPIAALFRPFDTENVLPPQVAQLSARVERQKLGVLVRAAAPKTDKK
jgi:hypothetical protein